MSSSGRNGHESRSSRLERGNETRRGRRGRTAEVKHRVPWRQGWARPPTGPYSLLTCEVGTRQHAHPKVSEKLQLADARGALPNTTQDFKTLPLPLSVLLTFSFRTSYLVWNHLPPLGYKFRMYSNKRQHSSIGGQQTRTPLSNGQPDAV